MRYRASVSFEHDTQPVRTYRGEIAAPGLPTATSRALRTARGLYPGLRWRSVVIVLEKLDAADDEPEGDLAPEAQTDDQ